VRLLCLGDVVGQAGRSLLKPALKRLIRRHQPQLIVVNGENAAAGAGLTPRTADEIFKAGADVITTGNHIWSRREILPYLETHERLLRPANYPDPCPGVGVCIVEAADGTPVAVVNLIGRLFLDPVDDPFSTADAILEEIRGSAPVVVVDFHAEATSEKVALGWYLDGRVSAVVGTHTHIPTADERVLPGGTAYVTDLGMSGPYDSVIGVKKEAAIERFRIQRPVRLSPAEGDVRVCGVVIEVSETDGKALSITRIEERPACGAVACGFRPQ
jgi:metallophosphoesterase (TIGR00282 family)